MEYITHSESETEALGQELAGKLTPGTVVAYRGGLGMGKTAFTRGLARGLGCEGRVTSPTFAIVNEYEAAVPLFHFDLYRLSGPGERHRLGGLPGPGWDLRGGVERTGRGRSAGGNGLCCIQPLPGKRELAANFH